MTTMTTMMMMMMMSDVDVGRGCDDFGDVLCSSLYFQKINFHLFDKDIKQLHVNKWKIEIYEKRN